jgi:hypothetical protein
MPSVDPVSRLVFKTVDRFLECFGIDIHLPSTGTTDKVVVILVGDFVYQVPFSIQSWLDHSVLRQEFEGAIDRAFCNAREGFMGTVVHIDRGEMFT